MPPTHPQVHPWTLASPPLPLVVSDTPSCGQLWALTTLTQNNEGSHPTRGCKFPPVSLSPEQVRWAHGTTCSPKPLPGLTSFALLPDFNSTPAVFSLQHASESPGGLVTSRIASPTPRPSDSVESAGLMSSQLSLMLVA